MKRNAIFLLAVLTAACTGKQPYDAEGTFEADEVTVSAEASGRILSLDLEEGDSVKAWEQIGAIDSVQLYLSKMQLLKSCSSVSISRPDISKQAAALRDRIDKQNTEKARVERLLESGAATRKQLDDINSSIKVLQSQLSAQLSALHNSAASIDAQSSAMEIQVAQVDDKLSKCRICSPVSGTVLSKYVLAGELAIAGHPLFKVADLSNMYLRAYVTSSRLVSLKLGQKVKVTAMFGGNNDRHYDGIISWISQEGEFTPKNIRTDNERADMVYAVKIAVKNDGYIKIGTFGQVTF
ncbi:MAG: efflux RND transporter periplasmic adaptor subunit [Bacteroidales bacterium]|jgi:HlyD family secretion protein|nr:efflux RND transporter periplasmic adaptor subunit [Bacteroidales bacterium]